MIINIKMEVNMTNNQKWWAVFLIEFISVVILLYITLPLYKAHTISPEKWFPSSLTLPVIILVIIILGAHSFKIKKEIKLDTKQFKSELLSIAFSFMGRVSLIVLGSYFAFYFVKEFGYIRHYIESFTIVSLAVILSLFLFARDCSSISEKIKRL